MTSYYSDDNDKSIDDVLEDYNGEDILLGDENDPDHYTTELRYKLDALVGIGEQLDQEYGIKKMQGLETEDGDRGKSVVKAMDGRFEGEYLSGANVTLENGLEISLRQSKNHDDTYDFLAITQGESEDKVDEVSSWMRELVEPFGVN